MSNPRSVLMHGVLELTLCTTCFPSRQGDKNIYMYNSCMYILSGVVSLCFQGKFLNMITRLEDIEMNTYTCIHKFHRLLFHTHNKEYDCTSMYLFYVYGTTHAYSHMNMNKKISIKAVKYCKCVTIRNALLCMI